MRSDTDVIRKVLDLTNVQAFECHGKLVARGTQMPSIVITNPVPVYGGGHRIGFATVDPDSRAALIFLIKECPERLDIENDEKYFIEVDHALKVYQGTMGQDFLPLKWVEIQSVRLTKVNELPRGSIMPPMITRSGV